MVRIKTTFDCHKFIEKDLFRTRFLKFTLFLLNMGSR